MMTSNTATERASITGEQPLEERVIGMDVAMLSDTDRQQLCREGFHYWAIDVRGSDGCTSRAQGTILKLYRTEEEREKDASRKSSPFDTIPLDAARYQSIQGAGTTPTHSRTIASKLPLRYL